MNPSITNPTNEMTMSSPTFVTNSTNFYQTPNKNYAYSNLASPSALNYMELFRTWNYHQLLASSTMKLDHLSDNSSSDYRPRNGSFHQHSPRLIPKTSSSSSSCQQTDDEYILGKFQHDTLVNLDTGEAKNIQQLTTNDFLTSAKQNPHYSRLLNKLNFFCSIFKIV